MKNYIVELIGTFILTLVIALSGNPLAIGFVLVALVYMGGQYSGAHYNPAVTAGIFFRGKIERVDAIKYIGAQVLGSLLALLVFYVITAKTFIAAPNDSYNFGGILLVELLFTFVLVFTILNVATSEKTKDNQYYGIAIGLVLIAIIGAGMEISGAVYNPAIAISGAIGGLLEGEYNILNLVVYLIAQFAGGIAAAYLFNYLNDEKQKEEAITRSPELSKTKTVLKSLLRFSNQFRKS